MHATIRTGTNGTIDTRGPGSHGKLKENKIIIKKKNSGKKRAIVILARLAPSAGKMR